MVSLAFVISFVVSAVALLIGIIIFSDVAEAMSVTLPILELDGVHELEQNNPLLVELIEPNVAHLTSTYDLNVATFDNESIVGVTIPIAGVPNSYIYHQPLNAQGFQPLGAANGNRNAGFGVDRVTSLSSAQGLFSGQVINSIDIETLQSGTPFQAHVGLYSASNNFLAQTEIVNVIPDGDYVSFPFTTPFIVPPEEFFYVMLASNSTQGWAFQAVGGAGQSDISSVGSNTSSVIFPSLPTNWQSDEFTSSGLGDPNIRIQLDSVLPRTFEVGLYDSSLNLLGSQSASVTTDEAQDIFVEIPVDIPVDGIVSVGLFGDNIEFLGDPSLKLISTGVSGIPDPFIIDPTIPLIKTFGDRDFTLEFGTASFGNYVWSTDTFTSADGLMFGETISGIELQSAKSLTVQNITVALYGSASNLLVTSSPVLVNNTGAFYSYPITPIPVPADEILAVRIMSETGASFTGECFLPCNPTGSGLVDRFNTYPIFPSTWSAELFFPIHDISINSKLITTFGGQTPDSETTVLLVSDTAENSQSSLDAHDKFNNTQNIGFTVIGVLPIALFFGLFSLLSGRGVE